MRMSVLGLGGLLASALAVACTGSTQSSGGGSAAGAEGSRISVGGQLYRDLNRNGTLEPYEDHRLPAEVRADDLVTRMTLAEKAGAMMHGTLQSPVTSDGSDAQAYDLKVVRSQVLDHHINTLITRLSIAPGALAAQHNAVQRIAAESRLGIPVTVSTDPRSHFAGGVDASDASVGGFSQWPETLGLAAIRDVELVRRFAEIARQEYRAVGIHMALSPQADLATEPRWPRIVGTFGSQAELVSMLVGAYVEGFQGGPGGLHADGVATVVKHWVGYGAQPEGFDAHNYYGRVARLSNTSFARHVAAFQGALDAATAGVMPAYPVLEGVTVGGQPVEPVAVGYNGALVTGLLRGTLRFSGVVLSDWGITRDCDAACLAPTAESPQGRTSIGMPWGVEALSRQARVAKAIEAGIDQFGGMEEPDLVVESVRAGRISEARLDVSVRRIMVQKFRQGLFDDPFVDDSRAPAIVGSPAFQAEANTAQRRAQVILENRAGVLPLRPDSRPVWLYRVDPHVARAKGFTVVDSLSDAALAIVRISTPFERLHPYHFFGGRHTEGRLDFRNGDADWEAVRKASAAVPTVVIVELDRPAVLSNVRDRATALVATFGASDAAVLDVVSGRALAEGRLPFELPSSMAAVGAQDPAAPDDTAAPLYPFGAGLDLVRTADGQKFLIDALPTETTAAPPAPITVVLNWGAGPKK